MIETAQQGAPIAARGANIDERSGPRFLAAGVTDCGRVRTRNEDALLLRPELGLFVVADGVSGVGDNEGGALAAQLAVETMGRLVRSADPDAMWQAPAEVLRGAVQVADTRISEEGRIAGFPAMGTTIAALLVVGAHVIVAHVGDSRVYHLRRRKLSRLTVDHTLLAEWEAIHERRAPPDVRASTGHILTRALGGRRPGVKPDVEAVGWQPGDVFLLCSDGLHGLVSDDDMADIVARAPDLDRGVTQLVTEANRAGGYDNATAILVRMLGQ